MPTSARFRDAPECGSQRECFDAVCGGVDYRGSATFLETLDLIRFSLRPEGSEPKPFSQLVGPTAMEATQECLAECLLPSDDVKQRLDNSVVLDVFFYLGLRRSARRYYRAIRMMRQASMPGYQLDAL